ncbi:MAG TPA: hypothetical protein VFY93_13250 [Planctomycetota bacterium]|nr:hypothetical protein [Planctomycetota bacterium]
MARGRAISSNPQFQIRWRDVSNVAQDVTTGMTEEESARAMRSERPLFVFITDPDATEGAEDDKAFTDERVAVGARFFDCVRISKADASEDRILKPYVAKAPILVFLRPSYEVTGTHPARFNASKIFDAMSSTMKKDYKNSVDAVLKAQRDIEKERAALDRDREKLAKLEDAKDAAKAEKLRSQISATESDLGTREETLYKLEPKDQGQSS